MKRTRLAAITIAGLIAIGTLLLTETSATAASITAQPTNVEFTVEKISAAQSADGFWANVTAYPSINGTLSGMAKHYYGKASLWPTIYKANKSRVADPNIILDGQRLWIPKLGVTVKTVAPATKPKPTISSAKWVNPLKGAAVTSCFGMRWGSIHQGVDLAKPTGTPIRAVSAGTIYKSGWIYSGYGISVFVNHGGNVYTHYAHMSREIVSNGQRVKAGQIIGYVGATGHATGPHLHFEVHKGLWNQINPAPWLRARGIAIRSC